MDVAVDRPAKMLTNELRRFEVELPSAEKIHVERVEPRGLQNRLEPKPVPARHTAGQNFAPSLVGVVAQLDAVVGKRNLDHRRVARDVLQRREKALRSIREITADFYDRNN